MLETFKNLVQDAGLVPATHPRVDGVPISESFREPPPFASVFHDIQDGIEHFKVVIRHITPMHGETIGYTLVLGLCDLHHTVYFDIAYSY